MRVNNLITITVNVSTGRTSVPVGTKRFEADFCEESGKSWYRVNVSMIGFLGKTIRCESEQVAINTAETLAKLYIEDMSAAVRVFEGVE